MPGDITLPQVQRGLAAQRAAEALLRTLGGSSVLVRVPTLGVAGDAAQLGLAGAATEDVQLQPVVVRNALVNAAILERQRRELLVPASALVSAREIHEASAAREFFESAVGIFVDDRLLRVVSVFAEDFGGVPYLYRIVVSE